MSAREIITMIGVGCVFAGGTLLLFLNDADHRYIIWYYVFMQALLPVGVVLHELGHAWAGIALGGVVHYIRLGHDDGKKEPRHFRALGFVWLVYGYPGSGAVYSSFLSANRYRTKRCLMIAGGPAVNVVVVLASFPFIWFGPISVLHLIGMGWILANGILAISSIIPFVLRHRGVDHPNDATLLWRTILFSDDEIRQYTVLAGHGDGLALMNARLRGVSLEKMKAALETEGGDVDFLAYITLRLQAANDPLFEDCVRRLIAHPEISAQARLQNIDLLLTWQLHKGLPDQPEWMDEFSRELIEANNEITAQGTRGSVLVDLGRISEGKAILENVLRQTKSDIDKTYSNVFLALAEKAQGNLSKAQEYATAAKAVDGSAQVLSRVADLLEAKPN